MFRIKTKYLLCIILMIISLILVASSNFNLSSKNLIEKSLLISGDSSNNDSVIHLIGQMGNNRRPDIVCSAENRIFISWLETENLVTVDENDTIRIHQNDTIHIQEISSNLSEQIDSKHQIHTIDLGIAFAGIGDSRIVLDSEDNLHIFWGVLEDADNQLTHVFYKKLTSNLSILVDTKLVFTYDQNYGISSPSSRYFNSIQVDLNDSIHCIFHDFIYLYFDSNGSLIDFHEFDPKVYGRIDAMVIDQNGYVLASSRYWYDSIYLIKYSYNATKVKFLGKFLISFNTVDTLINSRIDFKDGHLFISCTGVTGDHSNITQYCKEIDYSGNNLNDAQLGVNRAFNSFYNNNHSLVFNLYYQGDSCAQENTEFFFGVCTFNNTEIVESRHFLTIARNTSYSHGPAVFGVRGLEDQNGYFWFTFYVNDGSNGFQVLFTKIDISGNQRFSIIEIAPIYYTYIYNYKPEISIISSKPRFLFLSLLVGFLIINIKRRRSKM